MIGVGIIGAGRICRAHGTAAMALTETRVAAVSDLNEERLAKARAAFGCAGYADYRAMLEDPQVEAVVVALPHALHRDVTVDCLDAGRHVLLEKPMAMTVAECDAMIAAAERAGKRLMVAHSQRFFPVNVEAGRLLRDGAIGEIVMATDTWYKPFFGEERPPWFLEGAQGGGMWPMNGSHMIDRLLAFVGREVVAVKAKVGSPIFGMSATDAGIAFLEFDNGVAATIAHAGYRDGVNRFEAEITGTEGQLRINGDRGGGTTLWRSRDGQWEAVEAPAPDLPLRPDASLRSPVFGAQMLEFARAIREERPPLVSGEYGREVVRVLTACEESSRTGREVRLRQGVGCRV